MFESSSMVCGFAKIARRRGENDMISNSRKGFDLTNYTQSNRQTESKHYSTMSFPMDKLYISPSTKHIRSTCIPKTDMKTKCY